MLWYIIAVHHYADTTLATVGLVCKISSTLVVQHVKTRGRGLTAQMHSVLQTGTFMSQAMEKDVLSWEKRAHGMDTTAKTTSSLFVKKRKYCI